MIYIAVLVGVIVVALLLLPFWSGSGGLLAASGSIRSPEVLVSLKEVIVRRYLEDERAHQNGTLGKLAWEKRRTFLINRYIDAARRLDFLEYTRTDGGAHAP